MVWFRNVFAAAAVIAALTVFSASASAQSQVVTYSLAGVETAATSTEGTFVGVAINPDDFGTWRAVVDHDPLDDTALITGGSFASMACGANSKARSRTAKSYDWAGPAARRRST